MELALSSIRSILAGSMLLAVGSDALAFAQRTFVASGGSDAFPCSLAQPCRSFSVAIANTNANGEIVVLDSAGYGPVTITKSVTIGAPLGVYAGITVFSGDGVTVDGSGIAVTLRGLSINGQGGDVGVNFLQGAALTVENCEVVNMMLAGIGANATSSQTVVDHSVLRHDGFAGVNVSGSGPIRATISNSTLADNVNAVVVASFGGGVSANVTRSTITGNAIGVQVQAGAGQSASVLSDGNSITYASFAAFNFTNLGGSEIVYTVGNNAIGYVATVAAGGTLTPCCTN